MKKQIYKKTIAAVLLLIVVYVISCYLNRFGIIRLSGKDYITHFTVSESHGTVTEGTDLYRGFCN